MAFSVKDKDLRLIVEKAVNSKESVKIVSQRVEPFSKNRHGIMGNHYTLVVQVEVGARPRSLQFFVKTPPESTTVRDTLVDEWVSLEEVHFFESVYPLLMENYRGAKWCPTCYLAKAELLVFEDLRCESFSIRRESIYDEESLKSALSTLARFHASSIIAETATAKPLNQVYRQAFREKIFGEVGKGARSNKLGFDTIRLLAQKFRLDASLLPSIITRLYQLVEPLPEGCNVICHGDLWRSNIMFNDAKTPPECMIVDYQMLRYAHPSVDVAVMVYVHTRPEFRANSELPMLQHYHSVFQASLRSAGLADDGIPTYDSFARHYDERKLIGMACACTRWPSFVFDNLIDDPVALENWYFRTRIDVYEKAIDEDPNYAAVMRDYLMQFFDEGKRVLNVYN